MRLPNHIHDDVDAFPPCRALYHIHKVFRFVVRDVSSARGKGKKPVELFLRRCRCDHSAAGMQVTETRLPGIERANSRSVEARELDRGCAYT